MTSPMAARPRLGFIGLGLMGSAMSLRLLEKGWALNVWNLEPERIMSVHTLNPDRLATKSDITKSLGR